MVCVLAPLWRSTYLSVSFTHGFNNSCWRLADVFHQYNTFKKIYFIFFLCDNISDLEVNISINIYIAYIIFSNESSYVGLQCYVYINICVYIQYLYIYLWLYRQFESSHILDLVQLSIVHIMLVVTNIHQVLFRTTEYNVGYFGITIFVMCRLSEQVFCVCFNCQEPSNI